MRKDSIVVFFENVHSSNHIITKSSATISTMWGFRTDEVWPMLLLFRIRRIQMAGFLILFSIQIQGSFWNIELSESSISSTVQTKFQFWKFLFVLSITALPYIDLEQLGQWTELLCLLLVLTYVLSARASKAMFLWINKKIYTLFQQYVWKIFLFSHSNTIVWPPKHICFLLVKDKARNFTEWRHLAETWLKGICHYHLIKFLLQYMTIFIEIWAIKWLFVF